MSLCLINQTHGTMEEDKSIKIKSHILNLDTGDILCGRNVSGGFGADFDFNYIEIHPLPLLMKCICVNCLKKAFDILEREISEDDFNEE